MKTSELVYAALDWAVAKCEGTLGVRPERCFDCKYHEERSVRDGGEHYCHFPRVDGPHWYDGDYFGDGISADHGVHQLCPIDNIHPEPYSTDWSLGGPIIERERIDVQPDTYPTWSADRGHITGPTLLVAAMRCYVADKLNGEVEIPEKLT
jgi:hypothetical protein